MGLLDSTGFGEIADLAELGFGIGELISGKSKQNQANALLPSTTDPQEQEFYDTILNTSNTTRTGAAYNAALKQIKELATEGDGESAGDGADIEGRASAYDKALDAYGGVLANADKKQMQLLGLQDQVVDRMASRKADIDILKYAQSQQDARSTTQSGFSNITGALASAIGGFGKGTTSTTQPAESTPASSTGIGTTDGLSDLYKQRLMGSFPGLDFETGLPLYNQITN